MIAIDPTEAEKWVAFHGICIIVCQNMLPTDHRVRPTFDTRMRDKYGYDLDWLVEKYQAGWSPLDVFRHVRYFGMVNVLHSIRFLRRRKRFGMVRTIKNHQEMLYV